MFKNEPDSTTKFPLYSCPDAYLYRKLDPYERAISLAKQFKRWNPPYKFANFLLAEKATKLEIEIISAESRIIKYISLVNIIKL
ncbi:hypothetical protein [Metabacillus fastidiosus]|uniref:hypothetical protein n=1 Tax=Metabacillus fastidiosus TaxID=1458 RepID=UPI003D2D2786